MKTLFLAVLLACPAAYAGPKRRSAPPKAAAPAPVQVAETGGSSGNGGNAFVNSDGQAMFLDLVRLPSTVIFDHKRSEAMKVLVEQMGKHGGFSEATYFPYSNDPTQSIGARIREVLNERMQFQVLRSGQPLPDPKDKGLVVIPWNVNGEVRRLALQDPGTGRVMVDGAVLEKMSDRDIAAFLMHEALIKLWYEDFDNITIARRQNLKPPFLKSTDRIADIVNMTFVEDKFTKNLSAESVSAKMCEAGIKVAPENVQGLKEIVEPNARKFDVPDVFVAFIRRECSVRTLKKSGDWDLKGRGFATDLDFFDTLNLVEVVHGQRCYDAFLFHEGNKLQTHGVFESHAPDGPYLENGGLFGWEYRLYGPK
jgi:hypothetical protein